MSGQSLVSSPPAAPPLPSSVDRMAAAPLHSPSPSQQQQLPQHQQQQQVPQDNPQAPSTHSAPLNASQPATATTSSPAASSQLALVSQQPALLYPSALAKHETVVTDRDLFYDTLNKFHAALGTRLMIPTIGGKELDLHLLYVEVTGRGGLEQVIKDRKWKEVTVVFNFPPTTTSASYVLRKYYVTLLHHYEQVYFFGTQGPLVSPPAPLPGQSPGHPSADNGFTNNHGTDDGEVVVKKRRRRRGTLDPARLYGVDLGASVGHTVSGVIDGKFEHGYLVTVTVGNEKLRGVLYHMPSGSLAPQFAAVPGMAGTLGFDSNPEIRRRRRRRRKDEMPKKDPNAPKPNRSGYNFFFQEQHMRLKALHPDKDKEISRMIGDLWNKQTEEERAIYQERGVVDKERYKREMQEYRERQKVQAPCEGSAAGADVVMQPAMDTEDRSERPDNLTSGMSEEESCPMVTEEAKNGCEASEEKDAGVKNEVQMRSGATQNLQGSNG